MGCTLTGAETRRRMRACGFKIATKVASKNYLFIKTLAKVTFGYLAVVLITLFFAIYARSLFLACWKASWKVFRQSFLFKCSNELCQLNAHQLIRFHQWLPVIPFRFKDENLFPRRPTPDALFSIHVACPFIPSAGWASVWRLFSLLYLYWSQNSNLI